jgi:aconitase B
MASYMDFRDVVHATQKAQIFGGENVFQGRIEVI